MSNLKRIIENINNKNFDKALKFCDLYENNSNAHIISNLKRSNLSTTEQFGNG